MALNANSLPSTVKVNFMVVNLTFYNAPIEACLSRLGICGSYLCFEIEARAKQGLWHVW
jgi:hypothetical protein